MQRVAAISTTDNEAVYIAAAQAIKEIIWLKPVLYMHNQSAIRLLKSLEFHKRSKHIDVKYNFAIEKYRSGLFELDYITTTNQLADILAKPLASERFNFLRERLNMRKISD